MSLLSQFASKLKYKYYHQKHPFLVHPGFSSYPERLGLYTFLKKNIKWLSSNSLSCVEFGPFLGSSTVAMAEGLTGSNVKVHAYDAFVYAADSDFAGYTSRILQQHKISTSNLHFEQGDIDFFDLFLELCSSYSSIIPHRLFIDDSTDIISLNIDNKIGFAHIDLPKTMDVGLPIFKSLGKHLYFRSTLVMQDFALRWSYELILFVMLLIQHGASPLKLIGPSLYLDLHDSEDIINMSLNSYTNLMSELDEMSICALFDAAQILCRDIGDDVRYNELILARFVASVQLGLPAIRPFKSSFIFSQLTSLTLSHSLSDILFSDCSFGKSI